jgi:ATP-binding cassette subfamily B protein
MAAGSLLKDISGLWRFLDAYHRRTGIIVLYAVCATAVELAVELLIAPLVDKGILGQDIRLFASILGMQLLCYAASVAVNVAHVRAYVLLSADVSRDIRCRLFEKGLTLPPSYFSAANSAAIPSRILNEVGEISSVLGQTFGSFGVAALQCIAATVILFHIHWGLAAAVSVLLPVHVVLARRAAALNSALERDYYAKYEDILRFLQERFSFNARLIFSDVVARSSARERFEGHADGLRSISCRLSVLPHWLNLAGYSATMIGSLFVYGLGGALVISGRLSLGNLLMFLAVKSFLERPLGVLVASHVGVKEALVHWGRIREILESPGEEGGGTEAFQIGDILLRKVGFRYPNGARILDDANADIPARKLTSVQGATGTGKSTLMFLLLGHLRPDAGRITIAGRDLREMAPASLFRRVAYMGQDPLLFSGTIRENLLLFHPDASRSEIADACGLAAVEDVLRKSPLGLETPVAGDGANLSGGEKQRIALARALLKRPDLLILDEPTSALDEETERALGASLRRIVDERGVTAIVVSHRPAIAAIADNILRLDDGRLQGF